MKITRLVTLAAAVLWLAPPVQAKTLALLVGVAKYDQPAIPSLLGPRNDVSLIWRALKARGADAADITVLTDGLPQGADFPVARDRPTHDAIMAGLDALAAQARKGDTVLFYYSGHGDLQPADPKRNQDEPEPDGMDQILLPADIGEYDPIEITYKNAIIDNDLGDKIDAIRATGAFVWAVIDACHSGTATRGDAVVRAADLSVLGKPTIQPQPNPAASRDRHGEMRAKSVPGEGGLAGFYAVDSTDRAIEAPLTGYNLPMVGEGKAQRMGLFTYHLHRMLTANTAATYRDLAQAIVGDMALDRTGGKAPPPVFDGDLDTALPGSDAARIPNTVTALIADDTLVLPVGSLQGFDVGASLALYAPGHPDQVIGHAEVSSATAVTAGAAAIAWTSGKAPEGLGTVAARVQTPAITFRFTVAPPPAADFASADEKAAADKAIAAAFVDDADQLGVTLGAADDSQPDASLRVKNGRLWILRPDRPWVSDAGAYDETPSLALDLGPDKLSGALRDAVWSLARAAKLIRVASAVQQGADGETEPDLTYTSKISRAPVQDAKAACAGDKPPPDAKSAPLDPLLPAAAGNCSFVDIEVKNESHDRDYYVAGFYVDSLGGVSALPAKSARTGCVRTLPMGGDSTLAFRFWIDTWNEKAKAPSSVGPENFVILAVPKDDAAIPPKLCALTQPTLAALQQTRDLEGTRGPGSKLSRLIGGIAGATRGASETAVTDDQPMSARLFVFDVKP